MWHSNTTLRDFDDLDKFGLYESGTKVTDKPEILFGRLKAEDVMPEVENPGGTESRV